MNNNLIDEIKTRLKSESSSGKHALYQVLPEELRIRLGHVDYNPGSRSEEARLDYIKNKIKIKDKVIFDIGCNLGFFSLSFLSLGAAHLICYEGNKNHADFVKQAANLLGYQELITVNNSYYEFSDSSLRADVGLLLNVLHHVGDDYGDASVSKNNARHKIIEQLNKVSESCETLIFQLGFNWRGDSKLPLFTTGTKKELIEFITEGIEGYWQIESIAVAQVKTDKEVVYESINEGNLQRDDALGEFLNRPLFILKSLRYKRN